MTTHSLNPLQDHFQFTDLEIRTALDDKGEAWFCAKDVCASLDISWSSATLENMPENWKGGIKLITPGGEQNAIFINEAGLYRLIFRSNKPRAEEFANWVCEEVLPAIRKQGFFGTLTVRDQIAVSRQIAFLTGQLEKSTSLLGKQMLYKQLQKTCAMVGESVPDIKKLAVKADQTDLFDGEGGAS
jgi:prophage antirepressor-like protein